MTVKSAQHGATTDEERALLQTLAQLVEAGVVPRVARELRRGSAAAGVALRASILEEIPAFSASANPDVLPELETHARDHLAEIERLLGGGAVGKLEFVRVHSQRRAEQRFPLEATLHAYRCGHKVLSRWMRDATRAVTKRGSDRAIAAMADFAIEYTNAISTVCAAEYVTRTRALAEAEGDRRTELLSVLLAGADESDGRVTRLLRHAGYLDQRLSFCVVLARSADPAEMHNPARVQRLVGSLTQAVAATGIRALAGTRLGLVNAVFSDKRRLSGWTAPRAQLAARLQGLFAGLGPAVLIGISDDQPSTAFIPRAVSEATTALDSASVGARVVRYADLSLRGLLLRRAARDLQPAPSEWLRALLRADAQSDGKLVRTLRALADADLNVQKAARALKLHPNTLYARAQRIDALTGKRCQCYHDLTELLLAVDCHVCGQT